MSLQPCYRRTLLPLSWLSRTRTVTMPLKAKIQNAAFSQSAKMEVSGELPEPNDVLFGSIYCARTIQLNRPNKLNSLNSSMARKILPRLREWEKSDLASVVIMAGAGQKAFCAGGDVASLAADNKTGEQGQARSAAYFALEYQLDHLIATYKKPYVAYMDGITMGGGVGLSVHAPFRIATERTLFAMPETGIGFFPDVGASFFLTRLDGFVGTYLALTSAQLKGPNVFYAGLATHYLDSSSLGDLTARLSELAFSDRALPAERLEAINATIEEFNTGLPHDQPMLLAGARREAIDRCFQYAEVEQIITALEREAKNPDPETAQWAQDTIKTLSQRSPTSLKVTLRQMILGRNWRISEAFQNEYQIATHFMQHPDFVEGVEAVLKKPKRTPKWNPQELKDVSSEDVDAFFQKSGGDRLTLLNGVNFLSYEHRNFGLPLESDVKKVVEKGGLSESKVTGKIMGSFGGKQGTSEKVNDVITRMCSTDKMGNLVWNEAKQAQ